MNLSCVNEHIRIYAERIVSEINSYVKFDYTSDIAFKQRCFYKLSLHVSTFAYTIKGESCFEYSGILHIYAFLKSQVLNSYQEISYQEIISKLSNQILIKTNEFIGLYIYSLNNNLCCNYYDNVLLEEYKIKNNFQSKLMEKIKFKQLMIDYEENQIDYANNGLDKLLDNRELTRYLSEFIYK